MVRLRSCLLVALAGAACHGKSTPATPTEGDAVANLVIGDLASPAFGEQKVARACVTTSATA